ncbi:non-hydrolyzing UDP-N-acetylglucosamine 2-epimerase [Haladaptatus salinisoli]|uniref:non-hydrolyzing UDP-N-acetylglucosamine 2-epimerase n=1 Tax=Haladaptatus salinisoli TaxID=2884876 RepID=UPI001D0AA022|nr:UDP-N-acetylglucosamine 2-epimerase (non-hydrolyzing) [Haladaptatus salinisoli]
MGDTRFVTILGTRPEIIKLSPIIRKFGDDNVPNAVIHTGQHYSENLDAVFFEQLDLPPPEYNLDVGSGSHGRQTAEMLARIEDVLADERPDAVLVQGDTNSVLAGALASAKLDVELAHVEAGLRSFDRRMPEEVNRVLTDHAADYLFAPTEQSKEYLRAEGISDDRIFVTGNTIVDAVEQHRKLAAQRSTVLDEHDLIPGEFCLMTAHRASNVDDPGRFACILDGVASFAEETDSDIVYPLHPRAESMLAAHDLPVPDVIRVIEPQDFLDFLRLESASALVFTDSGGVQEEACILNTPCVTMRTATERPETLEVNANVLVGTDPDRIRTAGEQMLSATRDWPNPFGNGTAAERIVDALLNGDDPSDGRSGGTRP